VFVCLKKMYFAAHRPPPNWISSVVFQTEIVDFIADFLSSETWHALCNMQLTQAPLANTNRYDSLRGDVNLTTNTQEVSHAS